MISWGTMEILSVPKLVPEATQVAPHDQKPRTAGEDPEGGYGPFVGPYGGAVGSGLK